MIRATPAQRHALRALSHPWSVLAVALLVVNDHVLKRHWPSALTGKLSDLAGVFFFPFLLACALALATRGADGPLERRRLGLLSLAITGLWFAAMKLDPAVNVWTERLAGWVAGPDARIVMDPTDLVALVMLWPAWRLWRRTATAGRGAWPVFASPVAQAAVLLVASFGTMATTCSPQEVVRRVQVEDGRILVGMTFLHESMVTSVFASDDGGATWSRVDGAADSSLAMTERPDARPGEHAPACAPPDRRTCYRVAGEEHIEVSRDAGATWSTSWRVTPGRKAYRERYSRGTFPFFEGACPAVIDPGPFDVAILGEGDRHVVVVAAGSEGVLTLGPEGPWRQAAVGVVQPTPLQASLASLEVWPPIQAELLVAILAAGVAAALSMRRSRRNLMRARAPQPDSDPADARVPAEARMASWSMALLILFSGLGLALLLWPVPVILVLVLIEGPAVAVIVKFTVLAVLVANLAKGLRRRGWDKSSDPAVGRALRRSLAAGAVMLAAVIGPMVLWSVGTIPEHRTAAGMAVALGLVALTLAWRYPDPAEPFPDRGSPPPA